MVKTILHHGNFLRIPDHITPLQNSRSSVMVKVLCSRKSYPVTKTCFDFLGSTFRIPWTPKDSCLFRLHTMLMTAKLVQHELPRKLCAWISFNQRIR